MSRKFNPLSTRHFPYRGNEHIPHSGERTPYVLKQNVFSTGRKSKIIIDSYKKIDIDENVDVELVEYPPKIYTYKCLNLLDINSGYYAKCRSPAGGSTGYIKITDLVKPKACVAQGRVESGHQTQQYVISETQKRASELGLSFKVINSSVSHSKKPDLQVSLSNTEIQFEIKGTNGSTKLLTFFDKSVSRNNIPKIIDDSAKIFIENNPELKQNMIDKNYKLNFIGIIDYHKNNVDSKIGFAGDVGTPSSGKMPSVLTTTNEKICLEMYNIIIDHFIENGDNYFVIHNRKTNTLNFYWTKNKENILKEKTLPYFQLFKLETYGGKSMGSTRIGFKAMLEE